MKLTRIYANTEKFIPVNFHDGVNIVLGKINHPKNQEKDSHNLGKSTLAYLIDFLLLKNVDSDFFMIKQKDIFQKDVYFLEMLLNSGKSVTIKRSIEKPTKVSIKIHEERYCDFSNEEKWDYDELPINSKSDETNPKAILNALIDFKILGENIDFRDYISYFLRTQNDYIDIFKLSKNKGKDIHWKPGLFQLLGFDKDPMIKKYNIDNDIEYFENLIKEIKKNINLNLDEVEKIKNAQLIYKAKLEKLKSERDKFNFFNIEDSKMNILVDEIESNIGKFTEIKYQLLTEIKLINESISKQTYFDLDKTEKVFNEFKIYFGEQIKKEYTELVDFNNKITNERIRYLNITLKDKTTKLEQINQELIELNKMQSESLSLLEGNNLYGKYQAINDEIIQLEKKLEICNLKYENVDQISTFTKKINELKSALSLTINELITETQKSNDILSCIQNEFAVLVKKIINKDAMIYISSNSNNNIDFCANIFDLDKMTSEADGNTYKKILCACFDLALLLTYSESDFFKFVYHDGVLESLEFRKREKYFSVLKEICNKYDIQYIFSAIEGEISPSFSNDDYKLSCVNLSDDDDYSGVLFKRKF